VIGQALTLLHLFLVRHARCEVHGETIHVGEAPAARALAASPNDVTTPSFRPSENNHVDNHDHCQVLSDRRDGTCDLMTIAGSVPPSSDAIEQPCPFTPPTCRRLYRLAPKLSPPTA
jgi:hypothetical protein